MARLDEPVFGMGAAFASAVLWAIGGSVYSRLSRTYPAHTVNFTRATLALPIFLALSVFVSLTRFGSAWAGFSSFHAHNISWLVVSVFASYAFGDVLFMLSTRRLGIPTAMAVASIYPLFSAIFAWYFQQQALGPIRLLGLLLAVAGTFFVVQANRSQTKHHQNAKQHLVGILLAIGTSLCWALNTYSSGQGGAGVGVVEANVVRMSVALIMIPLIGRLAEGGLKLRLGREDLLRYWPVFVLESVVGSFLFVYGMAHAPLAIAAVLNSLAPVLTLTLALFMGWERFSKRKSIGIVFVVVGVCLLLR